MPPSQLNRSIAAGVVVSAIAVAIVTGLIYALRDVMPVEAAGVLYLLPVLLASSYWGLAMGIGTSILSALAFNFFHIPPTGGVHDRRRAELGRPGRLLRRRRRHLHLSGGRTSARGRGRTRDAARPT